MQVLQLYVTLKDELAPQKPMLKFFAVKAVVFCASTFTRPTDSTVTCACDIEGYKLTSQSGKRRCSLS